MKLGRLFILFLLLVAAASAWLFFGSYTSFSAAKKSLYIKTESSFEDVMNDLEQQDIVKYPILFRWLSKADGYDKDASVRPGKYVIDKGESLFKIARMLRSGRQTPVDFVITKLRTKEDLAQKVAENFECDSSTFINFLNNKDSLENYGLDTNMVMTAIIPNTYNVYWNTTAPKLFKKLFTAGEHFWNDDRKQKAAALKLSTAQVYILASLVEEETIMQQDKGPIASVYLNRLAAGMKLQSDPTIKFALREFCLKRIRDYHIDSCANSPYNTYKVTGLPPGPICTPSSKTIDAVLDAPVTPYLYFVAKPDESHLSNFAATYVEHHVNAVNYQRYLDSINVK